MPNKKKSNRGPKMLQRMRGNASLVASDDAEQLLLNNLQALAVIELQMELDQESVSNKELKRILSDVYICIAYLASQSTNRDKLFSRMGWVFNQNISDAMLSKASDTPRRIRDIWVGLLTRIATAFDDDEKCNTGHWQQLLTSIYNRLTIYYGINYDDMAKSLIEIMWSRPGTAKFHERIIKAVSQAAICAFYLRCRGKVAIRNIQKKNHKPTVEMPDAKRPRPLDDVAGLDDSEAYGAVAVSREAQDQPKQSVAGLSQPAPVAYHQAVGLFSGADAGHHDEHEKRVDDSEHDRHVTGITSEDAVAVSQPQKSVFGSDSDTEQDSDGYDATTENDLDSETTASESSSDIETGIIPLEPGSVASDNAFDDKSDDSDFEDVFVPCYRLGSHAALFGSQQHHRALSFSLISPSMSDQPNLGLTEEELDELFALT